MMMILMLIIKPYDVSYASNENDKEREREKKSIHYKQ